MTQHPEVLWAQRSSETDEDKVKTPRKHRCRDQTTYLRDYPKKTECSLRDHQPSRHPGVHACIRPYTNINLCQGKIRRVSISTPKVSDLSFTRLQRLKRTPRERIRI
jgi:hypothetical protein